jgi:hypothetical protein
MSDNSEILFNKLGTLTYTIARLETQLESLYKDRDEIYRKINEHFEGNGDNLDTTSGSNSSEQENEAV